MQLHGLHHVTAISADARENHRFYTEVLGLRLVKRTVNQDDTSAYHLFCADAKGSPGTDVTFFEWPLPRERRGTHAIVGIGLRVKEELSLNYWKERLKTLGVAHQDIVDIDGAPTLPFEDREGQRLALVAAGSDAAYPWVKSSVPMEHQIAGLGPIRLSVPDLKPTDQFLTQVFEMRHVREYGMPGENPSVVHVYEMGDGGAQAALHVLVEPHLPPAHQGAGAVHHVAFRAKDEAEYAYWADRLRTLRIPNSGPVDRYYFRSLYTREPNGILYEIATDGPGFAADEPSATLGERLSLPPFLEGRRTAIEAGLKPL